MVASPDKTYTFGSSGNVSDQTEEFGFVNADWIAEQEAKFTLAPTIKWKDVDSAGMAGFYNEDWGWDTRYAIDSEVRPVGGAAPESEPVKTHKYVYIPVPRGKVVGIDQQDPTIFSEGSWEDAVLARQKRTYLLWLQYIEWMVIQEIFATATSSAYADKAGGAAWSAAATNLDQQLEATLADLTDPEDFTGIIVARSNWKEATGNTAVAAQRGGNVGFGALDDSELKSVFAKHGISDVTVLRQRWNSVADGKAVIHRPGFLQGRYIAKPTNPGDERGFTMEEEFLPGAFGNVPLFYGSSNCDYFADVYGHRRLTGI